MKTIGNVGELEQALIVSQSVAIGGWKMPASKSILAVSIKMP
jgi:hypothetical protein